MSDYLIDTNCLISYTTSKNKNLTEKISEYIEDASNLKRERIIISNIITEFVYTLQSVYKVDSKFVSGMLVDVFNNPGIKYHHGYFINRFLHYGQV
jgi:predicted nucleic-acid-binding protein